MEIDFWPQYQRLQRYVGWSDYDIQRLHAALPMVEPHFTALIDDFYEEVDRHMETRRLLTGGRAQRDRLKRTLHQWLAELFLAEGDQPYVARRWQVGWRHVEVGLPESYAGAAMARLRAGLIAALNDAWTGDSEDLLRTIQSLNRALDLDMAIINHAYDTEHVRQEKQSARDRNKAELYDGSAILQSVLQTAVDGIITINHQGLVESMNEAAERLFGFSASEVIGRNVSMLMPTPYCDEHDQYLERYLESGEAKIIGVGREVTGRRKDGTTFPVELAVSEVRLASRVIFTGFVRDITERKRALQSERLAAIGEMMAGLAHESRNAFQRSQACLEMLADELTGQDDALDLVTRIQKAQHHLHHLYEEVRNFAAPLNLKRQPTDLSHCWQDTWANLEVMRHEHNVKLTSETGGTDLVCNVDPHAIEQVFRNALENAIVACEEPGEILIECRDTMLIDTPAVAVAIHDNGPGFSEEARCRVFEPFYTTKPKGTGLGMAISQRIVEAHGGKIVVPRTDEGATVEFVLPR